MRFMLAVIIVLGGCAAEAPSETYWRHADGPLADGQERLSRDEAACGVLAYQHETAFLASGAPIFDGCMRSRGWRRVG